jgi:hypothetical protein
MASLHGRGLHGICHFGPVVVTEDWNGRQLRFPIQGPPTQGWGRRGPHLASLPSPANQWIGLACKRTSRGIVLAEEIIDCDLLDIKYQDCKNDSTKDD